MTSPLNFDQLVQTYGTPLYVYSAESARRQYRRLNEALKDVPHQICFAMKACSNLSILKLFHEMGSGFDIVSEGELRRVLAAGGDPKKVMFAGVGKTDSEIEFALRTGIRMFNVESEGELQVIEKVAARLKVKAPVSFRINPNVKVETHPYLATGLRSSKFGIPLEEVFDLWSRYANSSSLELVGVDCHIGSQISELQPLREAYSEVVRAADEFVRRGAPIKYVDFGGGLGVSYSGHYQPLDLQKYGALVAELLRGKPYEMIVEPGKFLVVEAGNLLTQVLYTKANNENKFAIVDAGMNDLIRPSLYEAYHKVELVRGNRVIDEAPYEKVDIVGPVCETGCYLARERDLPKVLPGDLIVVRDAGAYGSVMASNYNSRALPAEVLVEEDGSHRLIRRREAIEELWRNEIGCL